VPGAPGAVRPERSGTETVAGTSVVVDKADDHEPVTVTFSLTFLVVPAVVEMTTVTV